MEIIGTRGFKRNEQATGMPQTNVLNTMPNDAATTKGMLVAKRNGDVEVLDGTHWHKDIAWASKGYEAVISVPLIIDETLKNIFNGISTQAIEDALILATVSLIERDPAYGYVSARLLLKKLFKQVTNKSIIDSDDLAYRTAFIVGTREGVKHGILSDAVLEFDLEFLAQHVRPERDNLFDFMGLKTLYERYFTKHE